jgi:hypothetical protein
VSPDPLPSLAIHPCLQRCRWRGTGLVRGEEPLFRCTSCGSEWVRSQPWAPVDCDGSRDAALEAELAYRPRPPRT